MRRVQLTKARCLAGSTWQPHSLVHLDYWGARSTADGRVRLARDPGGCRAPGLALLLLPAGVCGPRARVALCHARDFPRALGSRIARGKARRSHPRTSPRSPSKPARGRSPCSRHSASPPRPRPAQVRPTRPRGAQPLRRPWRLRRSPLRSERSPRDPACRPAYGGVSRARRQEAQERAGGAAQARRGAQRRGPRGRECGFVGGVHARCSPSPVRAPQRRGGRGGA